MAGKTCIVPVATSAERNPLLGFDMPDSISQIITDFASKKWEANPYERVVELLGSEPDLCPDFIQRWMRETTSGATFFDYAIGLLAEDHFSAFSELAVNLFRQNTDNEAAESFIAYTSLQSPRSLHPHLDTIFELRPNGGTYYAQYPWRESGKAHFSYLSEAVNGNVIDNPIRKFPGGMRTPAEAALMALLETRVSEAFAFVGIQLADAMNPYLRLVGFEQGPGRYRQLYHDQPWHICFPEDYFEERDAPCHLRKEHPTWMLSNAGAPVGRFGGIGCSDCHLCGGSLHHLVTLPGLFTGELPAISLETCLSCLGWEGSAQALFYKHDSQGWPSPIGEKAALIEPQFPAQPLKEAIVRFEHTPRRWWWQDWALSNSRENLNRVGGFPAWIQDSDYLDCPVCNRTMQHLLQLDSNLPTIDGGEWLWGSGGICYVGWCAACKVSGFQWQCT
jgi:hypothetical protein